jgi:4a-hydroxytetrahydrobiopterin dehydratase
MSLRDRNCSPTLPGQAPLTGADIALLLPEIPGWEVVPVPTGAAPGGASQLRKRFSFEDFLGAMTFVNRIAALAEAEEHHPDFAVHYNKVEVTIWTHSVGGLTDNDFILAAKIEGKIEGKTDGKTDSKIDGKTEGKTTGRSPA